MANEQTIENLSEEQLQLLVDNYNLYREDLLNYPEKDFPKLLQKIETTNRPLLRLQHLHKSLLNKEGVIPDDAVAKAGKQLEELRTKIGKPRKIGGVPAAEVVREKSMVPIAETAGLSATNTGWSALGPGNIGGRTRSIVIDHTDSQIIYAGSVGGGIWKSSDAGANWEPVEDLMANTAVCSLVMDPTDNKTLYAGTGEGYCNTDAIRGNGIFKTTDGWNWEVIKATDDNAIYQYVNGLAINSDASILIAGTKKGVYISKDAAHEKWDSTTVNDSISNLLFAPSDKKKCIAATLNGKIYYSTDSGNSWAAATMPNNPGDRITVAYGPKDSNYVYASVNASPAEIWVSNNGGQKFTKQDATDQHGTAVNFLGKQGCYDNAIWVDPTNKDLIIVGGIDLYRSIDGGNTLTKISNWRKAPQSPHADQHIIVADPGFNGTTNKTVYFGNDGGIYMTNDVYTAGNNGSQTNGWVERNNKYAVTQFYCGAGNTTTNTVIGGAQDNGTPSYTTVKGINNWVSIFGGDGGYVAADPKDHNYFYGEYVHLNIFRNTNGATSDINWVKDYICGQYYSGGWRWKPAPYTIPDAENKTAEFIAPFILDPNNSSRILAGGASLWRTNDAKTPNTNASGPKWASIKNSIGSNISSIAIADGKADIVYVGHTNGQIYKSINATAEHPDWTRIDNQGATPISAGTQCLSLAIDPNDSNTIYASFSGYQVNNIWKTSNAGGQWTNLGADLAHAPIRSVTVHPKNSDFVYIGTEVGVFASENGGSNWTPTNEGPTNCAVYDLFWMNTHLICVTHGRGMFQIDLSIHSSANQLRIGDLGGNLYNINPANGTIASTKVLGGMVYSAVTVEDDMMYVGTANRANSKVYAINSSNDSILWSAAVPGNIEASPEIYGGTITTLGGSILLVTAGNGFLYAYKLSDGTALWNVDLLGLNGTTVNIYGNVVVDNWLYISSDQATIAVNLLEKKVAWKNTNPATSAPLVANNMMFVAGSDNILRAYNARGGNELWNYNSGNALNTQPVWILGAVVVGDAHGKLSGIYYKDGTTLFTINKAGQDIQSLTADSNILYFVGNNVNARLYATEVDPNDWSITQKWSAPVNLGSARGGLVVGKQIYLSLLDKTVVGFDTTDGSSLWSLALSKSVFASLSPIY